LEPVKIPTKKHKLYKLHSAFFEAETSPELFLPALVVRGCSTLGKALALVVKNSQNS